MDPVVKSATANARAHPRESLRNELDDVITSEMIPTMYQYKSQNISIKGSDRTGIYLFREKTEM